MSLFCKSVKNISILLTGCINPNGMSCTALQDVSVRRRQYIDAIRFYLSNTNVPIVFVENSNDDISCFFQDAIESKRLECITFDGNNYDKSKGKGYGEALILLKAWACSETLRASQKVIKITGRIIVRNVNKILAQTERIGKDPFILVDFWGLRFIPTIVFSYSPYDFNEYLKSHYFEIDETKQCIFEQVFYKYALKAGLNVYTFIPSPQLDGVCGGWNCPYENRPFLKAFEINIRGLKYLLHKKNEKLKAAIFRMLYLFLHMLCFCNKKIYNRFICE